MVSANLSVLASTTIVGVQGTPEGEIGINGGGEFFWRAQSVQIGTPGYTLTGISFYASDGFYQSDSGNFVAIYSDSGNLPGTALATLAYSAPSSMSLVDLSLVTPITLTAGTTYWVVWGNSSGNSEDTLIGSREYPVTTLGNGTVVYDFGFVAAARAWNSGGWGSEGAVSTPVFTLSGEPVPEPATALLTLVGVTAALGIRRRTRTAN